MCYMIGVLGTARVSDGDNRQSKISEAGEAKVTGEYAAHGNELWQMADGRWQMADGRWRQSSGEMIGLIIMIGRRELPTNSVGK